jgi:Integrase core domain
MNAQNWRRSSRRAAEGRPGDRNAPRPDRPERRLRVFTATSFVEVLRRPLESAQYTSLAFGSRCREAGVRPSMGSVGDAYDNAMCESFFSTLEAELLSRCRFQSQAEARMACFSYIEGWYNPHRRHSGLGYLSPVAFEQKMTVAALQAGAPCRIPVGIDPMLTGSSEPAAPVNDAPAARRFAVFDR